MQYRTLSIPLTLAAALLFTLWWTAIAQAEISLIPSSTTTHLRSDLTSFQPLRQDTSLTETLSISDSAQITAPATPLTITAPLSDTTAISESVLLSETAPLSQSIPLTVTEPPGASAPITDSVATPPSEAADETVAETESTAPANDPLNGDTSILNAQIEGALSGTILANRTNVAVKFFVEGNTFTLPPLRSVGLELPRVTAVLNLYNCAAETAETEEGCYWDPYLLDRDGFYEIISGAEAGVTLNLTLQAAGSPPVDQVWVQNRSRKTETIVFRGETFELPPSSLSEFSVESDTLPTFFLRSCVELDGQSACEWLPYVAKPGVYYSLNEFESAGGLPGSQISVLELTSILNDEAEAVEQQPEQMICSLLVPTINVRTGPGLQFLVINKVRGSESEPGSVLVVGRDESADWLAVDERVASGGWLTGSPNFVACDGDILELPILEMADGRLEPTPEAVVVIVPESEVAVSEELPEAEAEAAIAAPASVEIPEGQALMIVNNAFDREIRFTLDQRYRVQDGPSEIDLAPGASTNILVYPGLIGFSASSPWNGLSGNNDFVLEENQSITLWVAFAPDPDGSGEWILLY